MTISIVSDGCYRFCFGSYVIDIKSDNIMKAKSEAIRTIDDIMNTEVCKLLECSSKCLD